MDNLSKVLQALDVIEANLKKPEVTWVTLAKEAYMSGGSFSKCFKAFVKETPGAYFKKRRLYQAAKRLLETDNRIIDITYDYDYSGQDSFTEAFRNKLGITPGEFRKSGNMNMLKGFEKITVKDIEKHFGGYKMEFEIKTFPELTLIGLEKAASFNHTENFSLLWDELTDSFERIEGLATDSRHYQFSFYGDEELYNHESPFTLFVGIQVKDLSHMPESYVARKLAPMKCACFIHKGGFDTLDQSYDYIYGEGAVKNDYKFRDDINLDFEIYDAEFNEENPEKSKFMICVPIK